MTGISLPPVVKQFETDSKARTIPSMVKVNAALIQMELESIAEVRGWDRWSHHRGVGD